MSVLMSCAFDLHLGAHLPANLHRLSAWPCPEPSAGWAGPVSIRDVPGDGGATTGNTPGSVGPEADLLLQQAPVDALDARRAKQERRSVRGPRAPDGHKAEQQRRL